MLHDTGLLLNTTMVIQFQRCQQSISVLHADGDLDINADDEIELNSTLIDINGNVEISGTAAITGIATFTDDIIIGDGKTIGSASDVDAITIASNGVVTFSQAVSGTSADFDGGVTIDNITIDGTEIDLSSGDLTLDVAGDLLIDVDGEDVKLLDAGTQWGQFSNSSSNFVIFSTVSDKDILFKGNDGGSTITALTLDMSDAGTATFNHDVKATGNFDLPNGIHLLCGCRA